MKPTVRVDQSMREHWGALAYPPPEIEILKDSHRITACVSETVVVRVLVDNRDRSRKRMVREIEVCSFIAGHGGPVTRPSDLFPGPYETEGGILSFWQREYPDATGISDSRKAVEAIRQCHEILEAYKGALPHFTETLLDCFHSLEEETMTNISRRDHGFLRNVYSILSSQIGRLTCEERPLHGDCHLGNVIMTSAGYLWLDFESACVGPIEWDLSALPEESFKGLYNYDPERLELLKTARSWCVAIWCGADSHPSKEERQAAHYHLDQLRKKYPALS